MTKITGGGLKDLIEIAIKKGKPLTIYHPDTFENKQRSFLSQTSYERLLEYLSKKIKIQNNNDEKEIPKIIFRIPKVGDNILIGNPIFNDQIKMECIAVDAKISPNESDFSKTEPKPSNDEGKSYYKGSSYSNQSSLAFILDFHGFKFYTAGDLTHDVESRLASSEKELTKVDLMKISHHGSNSSTPTELLQKLDPRISVISSGEHLGHNHPDAAVIYRIQTRIQNQDNPTRLQKYLITSKKDEPYGDKWPIGDSIINPKGYEKEKVIFSGARSAKDTKSFVREKASEIKDLNIGDTAQEKVNGRSIENLGLAHLADRGNVIIKVESSDKANQDGKKDFLVSYFTNYNKRYVTQLFEADDPKSRSGEFEDLYNLNRLLHVVKEEGSENKFGSLDEIKQYFGIPSSADPNLTQSNRKRISLYGFDPEATIFNQSRAEEEIKKIISNNISSDGDLKKLFALPSVNKGKDIGEFLDHLEFIEFQDIEVPEQIVGKKLEIKAKLKLVKYLGQQQRPEGQLPITGVNNASLQDVEFKFVFEELELQDVKRKIEYLINLPLKASAGEIDEFGKEKSAEDKPLVPTQAYYEKLRRYRELESELIKKPGEKK